MTDMLGLVDLRVCPDLSNNVKFNCPKCGKEVKCYMDPDVPSRVNLKSQCCDIDIQLPGHHGKFSSYPVITCSKCKRQSIVIFPEIYTNYMCQCRHVGQISEDMEEPERAIKLPEVDLKSLDSPANAILRELKVISKRIEILLERLDK